MGLFVLLIIILGVELYPVLKDCWTCNIFSSLYNAFSIMGATTFEYFQENIFTLISVCLALWLVYETYKALEPSLTFLYPDTPKFDDNYFKKIYKKLFLTMAVIGLVILNNPRNVFSNTFELSLDFGSSISREFLRKKIVDKSKIPSECITTSKELIYTGDGVLSDNTRDDMVCLLKEVNLLRQDYMDIGIALVEYAKPSLVRVFVDALIAKVATIGVGKIIASQFSPKWFKKQEKKLAKLGKDPEKNKKKIERLKKIVETAKDDLESGGGKRARAKKTGKAIQRQSTKFAIGTAVVEFIMDDDIRMGVAGLGLVIGLFIINMFFAFIIVEKMLFLGVSILLLPILAACYIFEQTRSFATKSLQDTFNFAIGLIFMSLAMVMCAEINDWILGGMFSAPNEMNISRTQKAIALIKAGDIEGFNALVATNWYFVYVIFVIGVNALLIKSAGTFASWFNGSISESALVKPLWKMGTSAYKTTTSVVREIKLYAKTGENSGREKGRVIDELFKKFKRKKEDKNEE
ncbi:MAG: type IV secretion system protein [Alphaproteobacteria bacterium]|nr:type IV secretion system protein [Alphaproteobacteria bacterium]